MAVDHRGLDHQTAAAGKQDMSQAEEYDTLWTQIGADDGHYLDSIPGNN